MAWAGYPEAGYAKRRVRIARRGCESNQLTCIINDHPGGYAHARFPKQICVGNFFGHRSALSVFNIGYYWNIGLHFLGLADLTNLVYSAGLSLAVLVIWGGIVAFVNRREFSIIGLLIGISGSIMIALWGVWHVQPRGAAPQLIENLAALIGFAFGGAYFFAWMRQRHAVSGVWDYKDLVVLAFSLFVTTFQAGACAAAVERTDRVTYTVNTKGGVHSNARILRSGSAGFLLAVDGNVMFVPQGEIRSVRSELNR